MTRVNGILKQLELQPEGTEIAEKYKDLYPGKFGDNYDEYNNRIMLSRILQNSKSTQDAVEFIYDLGFVDSAASLRPIRELIIELLLERHGLPAKGHEVKLQDNEPMCGRTLINNYQMISHFLEIDWKIERVDQHLEFVSHNIGRLF